MDFGILNLMGYRSPGEKTEDIVGGAVEMTKLADEGGLAISWFAEHHFSNYGVCGSPLMLAAHCAANTRRIKLAPGILVLPLYSPLRLAEEIATVDALSGGRLIIGVGTGYQPFEFDRFNVDLAESKSIFEEYLEVIERGLSETFVDFQGKYVSLPKTHIGPRMHGGRKPEIWVAGHAPEVHALAARKGYPIIVIGRFDASARVAEQRPYFQKVMVDAGRSASELQWGLLRHCCVTDSKDEAREFAENARWQLRVAAALRRREEVQKGHLIESDRPIPNEPSLDDILKTQMIGDVETCIERGIEEIRRTGAFHISYFFKIGDYSQARAMKSLERFCRDVVPGIEKELGPLDRVNVPAPPPMARAANM